MHAARSARASACSSTWPTSRCRQPAARATIAATLGTREPLRGQVWIAINNGVIKDEIVEPFIHLEAYAGAARAFDSYQVALEVFAESRT